MYSISNQKIDPTRRRASQFKADGSPNDNDRVEIGPTALAFREWVAAGLEAPNLAAMREFRLQRLVGELQARDYAGLLCFDPLNIRYITDTTNMQLWITHNPARACFVSAQGYVILWDFHNCEHLSAHLPLVREVRHGASFFYFESGEQTNRHAAEFAAEVDAIMREHSGSNRRLAVDKMEIAGVHAFEQLGVEIFEGQEVTEHARVIKGEEEIKAMRCAMHSCEQALHEMEKHVMAGVTENDVWSVLHAENIRRGGEWIETRILSSGPRTNPWYQESGPRVIQDGELLAFDTDLIGVYGMCTDISRTWLIGNGEASPEQIGLYRLAHEHITANMELLKPGVSFGELTEKSHRLPPEYVNNRYGVIMHGVGLCDEYPAIRYPQDFEASGYSGVLEAGMMLCVEAYIGAEGGEEGVKLEEQVLITEDGFENLTNYPFDRRLMGVMP